MSADDSKETIRVAILDDYAGIANEHFEKVIIQYPHVQVSNYATTLNTRTEEGHAALVARLEPYTVVASMRERTRFPRSVLAALPKLRVLLTTGMRNAAIDLAAAKELSITVVGTGHKPNMVKGYDATNEQTWALILGLVKNIVASDASIKSTPDGWQPGLISSLGGKTLGLLGLGRLGAQAAVTGKLGFGMNILAWSSSLTQERADELAQANGLSPGSFVVAKSKEELFRSADVLSVHYVLSDRSRGIVAKKELEWMKKDAVLVNTSRGPLIDETDLLAVLERGGIRGVGLDVFEIEPLPSDAPWRRDGYWGVDGRSAVLVSPHNGYVEGETMHSWYEQQAQSLKQWLEGGVDALEKKIE
ncbi:hypothetical protein PV10_03329 [Exophiala mesophila]|uniref:D-isomer specific 2-hydroxyacid dehydrogenase NAD-binding domain-containing protein n=1 Tax=Exophiala mesophila TaxID=212818 RepID=A0A0D1ZM31_EXOME|nr:uncharacterized protein PV10_03329 [Exophiala mesophila]KIV95707.1 hypothetical protein PV10_03329 [Exophiala mesophila]